MENLMNVIAFSVTADQEVDQDFISITFSATETGSDPNIVQEKLAAKVKDALDIARPVQADGQVDVRSGAFQIYPTYTKNSVVNGYEGNAIIIVSGIDTKTIVALTGKIKSMIVAGVQQSVSAPRRKELERDLALKAIGLWREKATTFSGAFGADSYTLVNADIGFSNPYPIYARAMKASADSGGGGEISTEPGKETVNVSISGSIQIGC